MSYPHDLKDLADSLEVRAQVNEPSDEFRQRVALAYLVHDPEDSAEAVGIYLGKHPDDLTVPEIGIAYLLSRELEGRKTEMLEMTGDSNMFMTYNDYLEVVRGIGFEEVLSYEYDPKIDYRPGETDTFKVLVNQKRGMLLTAESSGTSVNSTNLIYQVSLFRDGEPLDELEYQGLVDIIRNASGGFRPFNDKNNPPVAYYAELDAREGVVSHVQAPEGGCYETLNPWIHMDYTFFPILNYQEIQGDMFDTKKELRIQRIRELPNDVQHMIGYEK